MKTRTVARSALAVVLAVLMIGGGMAAYRAVYRVDRINVVGYFDNSNGLFVGDEVRILGVPVGKIEAIEPDPQQVKISFWIAKKYSVSSDVNAVVVAPALVSARAIQLTPAYSGGPTLADHAVIPRARTAVPVEWDDTRDQLAKLAQSLQPTTPGGTSPMGSVINVAASNLRGEGTHIRDTIVKLAQTFSALGNHSGDIFSTVKNVATLTSALRDSSDVLRELNVNLASVSALLTDDPGELSRAVASVDAALRDLNEFVTQHGSAVTTTTDRLTSVTQALADSRGDLEQTLHVFPSTLSNFVNLYQPAQGSGSATAALSNFDNPLQFICGAIQAASRLGAEQSAKLCVQYLAPILKNRQYNFPPIGINPIVGATARPNEITYSEDWLRPDHVAPAPAAAPAGALPAEAPNPAPVPDTRPTDPNQGLEGVMVPAGVR